MKRLLSLTSIALFALVANGCLAGQAANPNILVVAFQAGPNSLDLTGLANFSPERLEQAQVPCGRVRTVAEALRDPQVEARQMLLDFDDPVMNGLRVLGNPIKLSEDGAHPVRRPPRLG